jgi:RNase P/RNase MRP subunit p29
MKNQTAIEELIQGLEANIATSKNPSRIEVFKLVLLVAKDLLQIEAQQIKRSFIDGQLRQFEFQEKLPFTVPSLDEYYSKIYGIQVLLSDTIKEYSNGNKILENINFYGSKSDNQDNRFRPVLDNDNLKINRNFPKYKITEKRELKNSKKKATADFCI